MTDWVRWLCHRLNSLNDYSLWRSGQPPGNNHIIIVLHQRCLNCSECFQRHLMFYTCNYNIRVTHRNGAIKHIFYTNQIHGGIISRLSLFILSLHALALHLKRLKYYFKSFCMKILSTLCLTYICRLYFPPECQQDRTLLRNQY